MRTDIIIEGVLSILTLSGYWMLTHGVVEVGAAVSLVSNIAWLFYATDKNSISIGIVNAVFAMINISILSN